MQRQEKIVAAFKAGCTRMDSALKGYGGCPMATDDLTGNIATEDVLNFLAENGYPLNINTDKWHEALAFSSNIFH